MLNDGGVDTPRFDPKIKILFKSVYFSVVYEELNVRLLCKSQLTIPWEF